MERLTILILVTAQALVDHEDEVVVTLSQKAGRSTFILKVYPSDIGQVIGVGGKFINPLRDIIKASATKHRLGKVYLEIDTKS